MDERAASIHIKQELNEEKQIILQNSLNESFMNFNPIEDECLNVIYDRHTSSINTIREIEKIVMDDPNKRPEIIEKEVYNSMIRCLNSWNESADRWNRSKSYAVRVIISMLGDRGCVTFVYSQKARIKNFLRNVYKLIKKSEKIETADETQQERVVRKVLKDKHAQVSKELSNSFERHLTGIHSNVYHMIDLLGLIGIQDYNYKLANQMLRVLGAVLEVLIANKALEALKASEGSEELWYNQRCNCLNY